EISASSRAGTSRGMARTGPSRSSVLRGWTTRGSCPWSTSWRPRSRAPSVGGAWPADSPISRLSISPSSVVRPALRHYVALEWPRGRQDAIPGGCLRGRISVSEPNEDLHDEKTHGAQASDEQAPPAEPATHPEEGTFEGEVIDPEEQERLGLI